MINIAGIVSVVLFYILILAVGVWASRKQSGVEGVDQEEEVMLAGRNIGMFVGIFTMTATWVGGGYINGTAEMTYSYGLIWCQAPLGYALSLMLGGIFFAHRMRKEGYITMLDPLQERFGGRMGGLLFIPALCGEVFWSAAILAALGATLAIIIHMDLDVAVIVSALIAVMYTWIGGLYSVAYTDVVQLGCIFVGLVMCIPFAWHHEAVEPITPHSQDWLGSIDAGYEWEYADYMLLLTFGGIPWQVYFQRVLSSKTASGAEILSYVAAFGCILMAIPPVLIGAIAKSTNWTATGYEGTIPIPAEDHRMILPLVLYHLTPGFVSFFGLGAVSAAVMSSADSSVLSASSMFARNVWKLVFRPRASETETLWVMRVSILIVGALATVMALKIPTIYGLWYMCSDLVYVILFPQLLIVVHFKSWVNTYGSLFAYCIGMFMRLGGGEPLLHLPALIHYPLYCNECKEGQGHQLFPFRTLAMVVSMFSLITVSQLARWLFESGKLDRKHDYFNCMFDTEPVDTEEMEPMRSADEKTYNATEDGQPPAAAAPTVQEAEVRRRKPERKPDPSVRQLRRQISFGTTTVPSAFTASLKRKSDKKDSTAGGNPTLGQTGQSFSLDHSAMGKRPDTLKSPTVQPSIEEDGESAANHAEITADGDVLSPTEFAKRMFNKDQRKQSLHIIKENIKEGLTEIRHEVKDTVKHMPDGHRGQIGAVVERPIPPYKHIKPNTTDQDASEESAAASKPKPRIAASEEQPPAYSAAVSGRK